MDDERVWSFEEGLWTGDAEHYRALIDDESLMVLPNPPFVLGGQQAVDAVARTPRWAKVVLSDRRVVRPQEGLIVVAYTAEAHRESGEGYVAHCSSTYRRLAHDEWRVVQHQQTPPLVTQAGKATGDDDRTSESDGTNSADNDDREGRRVRIVVTEANGRVYYRRTGHAPAALVSAIEALPK